MLVDHRLKTNQGRCRRWVAAIIEPWLVLHQLVTISFFLLALFTAIFNSRQCWSPFAPDSNISTETGWTTASFLDPQRTTLYWSSNFSPSTTYTTYTCRTLWSACRSVTAAPKVNCYTGSLIRACHAWIFFFSHSTFAGAACSSEASNVIVNARMYRQLTQSSCLMKRGDGPLNLSPPLLSVIICFHADRLIHFCFVQSDATLAIILWNIEEGLADNGQIFSDFSFQYIQNLGVVQTWTVSR